MKFKFFTKLFNKSNETIENVEIEEKVIENLNKIISIISKTDLLSNEWNGTKFENTNTIHFYADRDEVETLPFNIEIMPEGYFGRKNFYTTSLSEYLKVFGTEFYKLIQIDLKRITKIIENEDNRNKFTYVLNNYELSLLTAANSIEEYIELFGKVPENAEIKLISILKAFKEDFEEREANLYELERLEIQSIDRSIEERLEMEVDYLSKYVRVNKKHMVEKQIYVKVEEIVEKQLELKVKEDIVESRHWEGTLNKLFGVVDVIREVDPMIGEMKGEVLNKSIHFFATAKEIQKIPLKNIERRNVIYDNVYSWNVPIVEYDKVFKTGLIKTIVYELPYVLQLLNNKKKESEYKTFLTENESSIQEIVKIIDDCIYKNGGLTEEDEKKGTYLLRTFIDNFSLILVKA